MLINEESLSDENDNESDESLPNNLQIPPSLPSKLNSASRSYLAFWSTNGKNEQLISVNFTANIDSNELAISKIIHDHNHNHKFFWSQYYDHHTSIYNKPEEENKNDEDQEELYRKLLSEGKENEVATKIGLIKLDLLNGIQETKNNDSQNSDKNNPATIANYKYVDNQKQLKYSDHNI